MIDEPYRVVEVISNRRDTLRTNSLPEVPQSVLASPMEYCF